MIGAEWRHHREWNFFLLDDIADHVVLAVVHEMNLTAQTPVPEHARRLLVRALFGFKNTPDAAGGGGDDSIGDVERHDAYASGSERIEQPRGVGAQLLGRDRIRREPRAFERPYGHEVRPPYVLATANHTAGG